MRPRMFDVVVVGAGPAGSATAARLAREGYRVLLLDRATFPRPKPCGDCLSPAAVQELDDLGVLDRVRSLPHTPVRGWTIRAGESNRFRGTFPPGMEGIAVAREKLDTMLLEHATACGAEVRTGMRVTDLRRGPGGEVSGVVLQGGERVAARLVVGADGLRSVVVRRAGLLARLPRLRKIALTARLHWVGEPDQSGELRVLPFATIGIAPLGDGRANVTVVVDEAEAPRLAGAPEQYYDEVVARLGAEGTRRVGPVRATGPFDWSIRCAVADGLMLVGDAAGYFDPFTGQGIFRALRGASLAAGTAVRALASGSVSARALHPYEEARRATFGPGVRLQHVIEAFVARRRLFQVTSSILRSRPAVANALVAVTGDLLPVRSLWSPRTLVRLVAG